MSPEQMRDAIIKVYNSDKWRNKVREMSDHQVIAVYYNMVNRGTIK